MISKCIMIYVTFPTQTSALHICQSLLQENLVACANIFSNHISLYQWQGKICQESEVAVLLKTKPGLFRQVEQRLLDLHPYECPCILQLSVKNGHTKFLNWVDQQTISL